MDHKSAIENYTAERYLLGELKGQERIEFEEHFFSCLECAEEVRIGDAFMREARAEFLRRDREETVSGPQETYVPPIPNSVSGWHWGRIFQPRFAMACALLVFGSAFTYQNLVTIPRVEKEPQVLTSQVTRVNQGRGVFTDVPASKGRPFRLELDIPPGPFSSYDAEVRTAEGTKKLAFKIPAEEARNSIQICFRRGSLEAGRYLLVIRGVNSNGQVAMGKDAESRYPFSLQFQNE